MKALLRVAFWVFLSVAWLCHAMIARADSVTLIPVGDATISEGQPWPPLGTSTILVSGTTGINEGATRNRALLRFDVTSSIPSNAIVTSASLTMTVVGTSPLVTNLWFSLHKVAQDWSESAVTWTNRLSPPAAWSAPGGAPPRDYSSSVTQSNLITGLGTFTFVSSPDMIADVQDWVSNPVDSFGWILICELEGLEKSVRKFASREYALNSIPTNRPALEVDFSLPAIPPALTLLPQTMAQFQFQFNAESNRNYTAEYCIDLTTTNWIVLTNIAPLPAPANVIVSDTLFTDSNRFYRVHTP